MRVRGLILALVVGTVTAAGAQSAGSYEVNGFSRYTLFDNALSAENKIGGGGSLGFFVLRNLALEAEAAYTPTTGALATPITNIPLRGRLSYHMPLAGNATSFRLGVGYVRNLYRKGVSVDDDGFTGIAGLRLGITPTLGLRLDGTADYFRQTSAGRPQYVNWGGQAGLSFVFGNARSSAQANKDKDQDGVQDRDDRCPKTPAGKAVDADGCAAIQRDADGDRVNDEADRCPNSAPGAAVEADGCAPGPRDGDQDGVVDSADRCQATPLGERIDAEGCSASQKDDDNDGVMNNADRCPATRAGELVDGAGCTPTPTPAPTPAGPQDSDRDGVTDSMDQCPNTPTGEMVNARGCTRDTDGDGVPDSRDHCGSTPAGEKTDENGCPILFKKGARTVILRGVTFQPGKARLTPEGRDVLRDIASQLVENPEYRIQISGHTDNTGSHAANLRLSLARARTVETFLEANGVPPRQLSSKGFGPDVPIASNKTAAGRAKNRRVELNRTN